MYISRTHAAGILYPPPFYTPPLLYTPPPLGGSFPGWGGVYIIWPHIIRCFLMFVDIPCGEIA